MSNSFSKILIIQTAFIGDVILATSLIEKLSHYYPEAKIDFLLRKGNQILLKGNPKVGEVLVWNKADKLRETIRIIRLLRKLNYDLLINAQRYFTTGFVSFFSKAKYKIGFDSNPFFFDYDEKYPFKIARNVNEHEVDRLHQLISKITDASPAMPKLYPGNEEEEKILHLIDKPFITIHPGSAWATKQLPVEKWIELVNALNAELQVYLLGGPAEKNLCEKIKVAANKNAVHNKAGELNLLESAALMKCAKVNYVNDSAPLHICSSMDAPCISVFCSTIPEFGFAPLAKHSKVVQIKGDLYCRPCGTHGKLKCPEGHFKCGNSISIEDLNPAEFLQ
ncbi:MAG TPA: glycosyltransferase family 9 protein [Cyclobacteriaceae bacterium]|jgi:heptosyltransferase-2